jgi:hypothetical protein
MSGQAEARNPTSSITSSTKTSSRSRRPSAAMTRGSRRDAAAAANSPARRSLRSESRVSVFDARWGFLRRARNALKRRPAEASPASTSPGQRKKAAGSPALPA